MTVKCIAHHISEVYGFAKYDIQKHGKYDCLDLSYMPLLIR